MFNEVKNIVDNAGIDIWSIHMPGVSYTDLSTKDENTRLSVVEMHLKMLDFIKILEPKIILFHASHLVSPNEREFRKQQAVKSANVLNTKVMQMKATMVFENGGANTSVINGMTASTFPRTIDEILEFMNRLPLSIGFAVDMNHISEPHKLVLALRDRLKSVHISDGDGSTRCFHYFPCSGEGENDWVKILASLNEVNYRGPFMYECHYDDEKDLVECYEYLFLKYQNRLKNIK
jgi:sugar phosphate isomerase/epimerase